MKQMRHGVMGVLNVTPDSFFDGGLLYKGEEIQVDQAVERALQMVEEGADIIDIGGESTGPHSKNVSLEEELKRVIPVVSALRAKLHISHPKFQTEFQALNSKHQLLMYRKFQKRSKKGLESVGSFSNLGTTGRRSEALTLAEDLFSNNLQGKGVSTAKTAGFPRDILISVDTYKAEVSRQALEAGADMINDVTALRGDPDLPGVLAKYPEVPVVLMYAKDPTARTSTKKVHYNDVIKTVIDFLQERIDFAVRAGIARERIILDPGMGAFVSMDPKYSLEILRRLRELEIFKLPILVGASRKGFVGQVLGAMKNEELRIKNGGIASQPLDFFDTVPLPVADRLEGSLACAAIAALNGASIVRVHDVQETRRMFDIISSINYNYEKF